MMTSNEWLKEEERRLSGCLEVLLRRVDGGTGVPGLLGQTMQDIAAIRQELDRRLEDLEVQSARDKVRIKECPCPRARVLWEHDVYLLDEQIRRLRETE